MDVLWTAGLTAFGFADQVRAAAELRYPAMSVGLASVAEAERAGRSAVDLGVFAAEHGVRIALLEPLLSWLPVDPGWALARFSEQDVIRVATDLGATTVGALAVRGIDEGLIVERFAGLSARLADAGFATAIEFAPMSGVRDLAAANRLVDAAGAENAGIVFDTWHFFRGGGVVEQLTAPHTAAIRYVQVSDAAVEPGPSLDRDTYHRSLPGEGAFALTTALAALERAGALTATGPEVISPELTALGCIGAARRCTEAYRAALELAGVAG